MKKDVAQYVAPTGNEGCLAVPKQVKRSLALLLFLLKLLTNTKYLISTYNFRLPQRCKRNLEVIHGCIFHVLFFVTFLQRIKTMNIYIDDLIAPT